MQKQWFRKLEMGPSNGGSYYKFCSKTERLDNKISLMNKV